MKSGSLKWPIHRQQQKNKIKMKIKERNQQRHQNYRITLFDNCRREKIGLHNIASDGRNNQIIIVKMKVSGLRTKQKIKMDFIKQRRKILRTEDVKLRDTSI